jgi:hypothetical protein
MAAEKLVKIGGKLWEKGNLKRVYFNETALKTFYGYKYNSFGHTVDGAKISSSNGCYISRTLANAKFWFDLNTGEFASKGLKEDMQDKIVKCIMDAADVVDETEVSETVEADTPVGYDVMTAVGPGIQDRPRTNKKTGRCQRCGGFVLPGEGYLYYIDPTEAYEVSGWVVEHKEISACREHVNRESVMLTERAKAYVGN